MKLLRSFKNAFYGIIYALKNERNMRIHTSVAGLVLVFSLFFDFTPEKYGILFCVMSLVLVAEMFNSSVEVLIDMCSHEYSTLAKAAKDIAAGAVFIAAGSAVVVGLFLFSNISGYVAVWNFVKAHLWSAPALAAYAFFAYAYIYWGPAELKNKTKQILSWFKARKN